jgi:hypothetical protein
MQPRFQVVEDWFGLGPPGLHTCFGRLTSNFLLDAIELGNAFYGFLGNRRSLGFVDVDELAPDMGHAGDFAHVARAIKVIEPRIAIGMHEALVGSQMFTRSNALPVGRELIPCGGMRLSGPGPFIADIGPKPGCLGFAETRSQQLYRRVSPLVGFAVLQQQINPIRRFFSNAQTPDSDITRRGAGGRPPHHLSPKLARRYTMEQLCVCHLFPNP